MSDDALLGQLADEFIQKVQKGELPDIEDYALRHPDLAERIRELFPALMLLEGMVGQSDSESVKPSDPSGLPPDSMFGQYRIEREIGRGGMGIVYEAIHVLLDKRIALKILPVRSTMDASHLERFFREARTAAGLHHTNIVPVFDVGQVAGTPYFAMQYIEGRSLDAIMRIMQSSPQTDKAVIASSDPAVDIDDAPPSSQGKEVSSKKRDNRTSRFFQDASRRTKAGLPEKLEEYFRWVAATGIQAANGLAHAHERKVIHRDIKPSNLIVDNQGVVWIADFGLARRIEDPSMTQSGALLGTPRYMSPEQAAASRHPVDQRSDIYSLGATLYELLTCQPVFDGKTPHDVISQIITRDPVAPKRLSREIPGDLSTIVTKAMAKRPEDRYQSASLFAADLGRWLRLEPIRAKRIGLIGRIVRWCRRNPKLAAVTAAAGIIILTVSGIYYAGLMKEKRETQYQNYRSNLLAADLSYQAGEIIPAKQHLVLCDPDLRGWEWHYLNRSVDMSLAAKFLQFPSTPRFLYRFLSALGATDAGLPLEETMRAIAFRNGAESIFINARQFSDAIGREQNEGNGSPSILYSVFRYVPDTGSITKMECDNRVVTISPDGLRALSST